MAYFAVNEPSECGRRRFVGFITAENWDAAHDKLREIAPSNKKYRLFGYAIINKTLR